MCVSGRVVRKGRRVEEAGSNGGNVEGAFELARGFDGVVVAAAAGLPAGLRFAIVVAGFRGGAWLIFSPCNSSRLPVERKMALELIERVDSVYEKSSQLDVPRHTFSIGLLAY